MPSPDEWFSSLPPISKTWGCILLAMTAATSLKLLNPGTLLLSLSLVFSKFQVWRLLTCFLWAGPLGIGFLFELLMIAQCAVKLEQDIYDGRPADFLFVLIFGMISLLVLSLVPFFAAPFLSKPLITMMVYIWSRQYPNQNVSIMGFFTMPAFYFPFALVFLNILMGGDFMPSVLGCIVGHLYYFLDAVYPLQSGTALLVTPLWVRWIIFKWAQNNPGMFPESARLPPNMQRLQPRASPTPAPGAQPPGGSGAPLAGQRPSAGVAPRPAQQAQPQPSSSQAFRGRAYRLDRD